MSKWYEVTITQTIVVAVEVADNEGQDEAFDHASGEISMDGNVEMVAVEVVGPAIETLLRNADLKSTMEDV